MIDSLVVMQNQIRRLTAERNQLLAAIAPEDYAKIQSQMVAISESPDEDCGMLSSRRADGEL